MELFTLTFVDTENGDTISIAGERLDSGDLVEDGELVGTWMEARDLDTGEKVRYEVRLVTE